MRMTIKLLKENRDKLTPQQFRTLRGQCIAGDIDGAIKGFHRITNRQN